LHLQDSLLEVCQTYTPTLEEVSPGRFVSCHHASELELTGVEETGAEPR